MLWFLAACNPGGVNDTSAPDDSEAAYRVGPGCVVVQQWIDADRDYYGDPQAPVQACRGLDGLVENDLDCDDQDPLISPDGLEECDGVDNDCDGVIDGPEAYGAVTAWPDEDLDGFGPGEGESVCEVPEGWVTVGGDCDDVDAAVNPDAVETVDGVDDDCDGVIDDGFAFGDGADGDLVVTGDVDLGDEGLVCSPVTAVEDRRIEVADATGFANGDRALLYAVQGSFGVVGEAEWLDVLDADGLGVELLEPVGALADADLESEVLVLYRVPNFAQIEVSGSLTAPAFEAGCGGLLVLLASESITVSGGLDMRGAGFPGGAMNLEADSTGEAGDSWSGEGTKTNVANGGGGGGGGKSTHGCTDCESHGGGAGHGADGGDGERSDPTKGDGGQGGVEYGSSSLSGLFLGSGGGAGACDTSSEGGIGGAGGAGGGAIWLRGPEVAITGDLDVRGGDGQRACAVADDWCSTGAESEAGSGGGGSGGSVRVQGTVLAVTTPSLEGGLGADAADGTEGWAGDGATGRFRAETLSAD